MVLFVVAREQAELMGHLSREFPDGDVQVVLDRRHADRRQAHPGVAAAERRSVERRRAHASALELRSIGYSIIRLEDDVSGSESGRPLVNPTAVRQVEGYLRDHFRYYTAIPSWDRVREGQAFVILNAQGWAVHRVVFTKEFLDYYGTAMADRIPRILDEWHLPQRLELAARQLVIVSSYGVSLADS